MSKIIRIEEGIETYDEREKFFEDASIYLPSTLKNIGSLCFASYEEEVKFEVVYNGTKEDFLKIKKGRMVFTEVKDDFYGEYYHNTPSSSTTKKRYFNWISSCNLYLSVSGNEGTDGQCQRCICFHGFFYRGIRYGSFKLWNTHRILCC